MKKFFRKEVYKGHTVEDRGKEPERKIRYKKVADDETHFECASTIWRKTRVRQWASNPLDKWLKKQVGRDWDSVRAELTKEFKAYGQRFPYWWFIEDHIEKDDRGVLTKGRYELPPRRFYVFDGKLCYDYKSPTVYILLKELEWNPRTTLHHIYGESYFYVYYWEPLVQLEDKWVSPIEIKWEDDVHLSRPPSYYDRYSAPRQYGTMFPCTYSKFPMDCESLEKAAEKYMPPDSGYISGKVHVYGHKELITLNELKRLSNGERSCGGL